MASYILRQIDPELWKRVKSKAAAEGLTLRAIVDQLLRGWVKESK